MAFAVAISALMYQFMVSYAEDKTVDIKRAVYSTDECRQVSLNIVRVCNSAQGLNITLQNRNYIRVDGMDFRLYNGRQPLQTNITSITLNPNREKDILLGTGLTQPVTFVEVIPRVTKEGNSLICSEKRAQSSVVACS